MTDIRILYKKLGRIRYISHLDMNRLMQRALKRSELPIWYTQGFNPHMYITFALPLSLGFESEYEVMDTRFCAEVPAAEVVDRLNAQMPQGLQIFGAEPPVLGIERIAACTYAVSLETDEPAAARAALDALFAGGEIPVEKKTKRGMQTVDIRPHVELLEASAEDAHRLCFTLRCASGTQLNINPALAVGALCTLCGGDADFASYRRLDILDGEGRLFR